MVKWAELIEENIDEAAALDTMDAGKLYYFNKFAEIPSATNALRYYAGAADKIHGKVLKMNGDFHAYTLMEPIGVVGHIIPWNAPSFAFFMKVSPSLAAGCTMVLKPAEQTPLSALFYAHLAKLVRIIKLLLHFYFSNQKCSEKNCVPFKGWNPRWSAECGTWIWPNCWCSNKLTHGHRCGDDKLHVKYLQLLISLLILLLINFKFFPFCIWHL